MRRAPDLVLGIDEAVEVRVGHVAEQLAQKRGVLAPGCVVDDELAVTGREPAGSSAARSPRAPRDALAEQLVVPGELDERVAPIEENGADHRD